MSGPSLSERVVSMLSADVSVTNIVGNRIFRMRAPQSIELSTKPYIIMWLPTHFQVGHLRGTTDLEHPVVRFDFFGTNVGQLETLRFTVVDLMTSMFGAVYRFGTELYEDDTRMFHLMADFSVWFNRNSP